jgi:Tfp pilus assembly protein PilZ
MNPGAVLPLGDRTGIVTGTSAEGVSIATFRPFSAGETLGLIITLPFESESRTVSLSGKVVWSGQTRPDRFGAVSTSLSGIEFADCPNRSIIERFLEYWRRVAP